MDIIAFSGTIDSAGNNGTHTHTKTMAVLVTLICVLVHSLGL